MLGEKLTKFRTPVFLSYGFRALVLPGHMISSYEPQDRTYSILLAVIAKVGVAAPFSAALVDFTDSSSP